MVILFFSSICSPWTSHSFSLIPSFINVFDLFWYMSETYLICSMPEACLQDQEEVGFDLFQASYVHPTPLAWPPADLRSGHGGRREQRQGGWRKPLQLQLLGFSFDFSKILLKLFIC